MKTRISLLIAVCSILLLISAQIHAASDEPAAAAGAVTIVSSPGAYPLAMKWVTEYSRLHKGSNVTLKQADARELETLASGGEQIGFITGDELSALSTKPAWQIVAGRDLVVPVISSANPFLAGLVSQGVTPEDLSASLVRPGTLQWGTLLNHTENTPVHFVIPDDPRVKARISAFLGPEAAASAALSVVPREAFAAAVAGDPMAVGFCRLDDLLASDGQTMAAGIRLLPIDKNGNGKLDYMEQIYDNVQDLVRGAWIGKFPRTLTSELFSVAAAAPSDEQEAAFLSWVITDGQQYLAGNGFSELVINERQTQLDKISAGLIAAGPAVQTAGTVKYLLWALGGLILLILVIDLAIRFSRRKAAVAETAPETAPVFGEGTVNAPKGLYYDKTHTWVFMEQDGTVRAGIDDFLAHVTGTVTRIEMKNPGEKISKGDPFITIIQQGKKLVLYSPVTGTIRSQNRELLSHASLLHTSPYAGGWIYRIEPANWPREIGFLSMADNYREWLHAEFSRLKDFLASVMDSGQPQYAHVVLQDGGVLKEGLLEELSPEAWEDFQTRFLDNNK